MMTKQILSLSLLTFILQGCGDTQDEKNLKRRNNELARQNAELISDKAQTTAELEAAEKNGATAAGDLAKAQQDLEKATKELGTVKDAKTAAEKAKSKLETELADKKKVALDLNAQIKTKDNLIAEKEAKITELRTTLASSPEIDSLRAEITKLQGERDDLKTAVANAEAAATDAAAELQAAQGTIADLEARLARILQNSLADVRGLWLNQDEVTAIANVDCYQFVHVGANGGFAQAVACADGRVQIQKHVFDRFSASAVPVQIENDYMAKYGFAIDGVVSKSTCQDPANSILKAGNRLVFEMTRQDFAYRYGNLISKNLVVPNADGFRGFINGALNFKDNNFNYPQMAAVANEPDASPLDKAAAAFIGGLESQGTNISLGCFDANGVFTAASFN
ncbi:MAG TPA: hypothetical protein VE954_06050 [Oligoflexus sp.]|uniref:hypothetical protein n=1 Tax=Oligoflexus sp. TaxID=1971216 RepID=UPI002D3232F9|nr:hypothetical protein [Oligoflexus sp.]HYX32656.1 hypothetical protein [Oligoflexus sp.]